MNFTCLGLKESHIRLINELPRLAPKDASKQALPDAEFYYGQTLDNNSIFVDFAQEFYDNIILEDQKAGSILISIYSFILNTYCAAKVVKPEEALTFYSSWLYDYPGVPESCLLRKWSSLGLANYNFQNSRYSGTEGQKWEDLRSLFKSYNEFLNALISYLIILLQISQGKQVNPGIFDSPYGSKLDQLRKLVSNDKGASYLVNNLARPHIRNAIAHEEIFPDSKNDRVIYIDGRGINKRQYDLDYSEFGNLAIYGSYLFHIYFASICVISVMEHGTDKEKSLLPSDLAKAYTYSSA
jgi:hypothetical protein